MGAKQSKQQTTEIINDTRVQTALKNVNENINEMTMKVIQESLEKTAAGAKVKQEVVLEKVKATGDITISGVKQKAQVQISVSSLTNSELQQDLVTETMNELQTKLTESMKLSQEQAQSQGEQMISEMVGALSGAISAVTGTKIDEVNKTSLQNLLNIESDTELQNIVKQSINSELINKTVKQIANNVVGTQTVSIKDAESGGNIAITNIEQEFLSKQILESINQVGTGAEIISAISNTSKADIEKSIEAGQKSEKEEEGTLGGIGGVISDTFTGLTGFTTGTLGALMIPMIVVGVVFLYFMFSGGRQQQQQYQQQYYQQGGAKVMNIFNVLLKYIKKYSKIVFKYIKIIIKRIKGLINKYPYSSIIIPIIFIILFFIYRKLRYNRMENFTNEDKLNDVMISYNNRYLTNKKLGSLDLCFNSDIKRAFKFNINIIDDKNVYIFRLINDEKVYMKVNDDGSISLENYDFVNDKSYRFQFEKDNTLIILKNNERYIGEKDECLNIVQSKEEATELLFE